MRRGLPFELFVGLRYMRSKGGRGFLSLLTLIAMAGMAIGVMALIVVLAVMTGFEDELRSKILGTTSHILVMDVSGRGIEDPERALGVIRGHREVRSAAPFVLQQVMLSHGDAATGVVLRGIDPVAERQELQQRVKQGNLADLGVRRRRSPSAASWRGPSGRSWATPWSRSRPKARSPQWGRSRRCVPSASSRSSRSGCTSTTPRWPTRPSRPRSSSPSSAAGCPGSRSDWATCTGRARSPASWGRRSGRPTGRATGRR